MRHLCVVAVTLTLLTPAAAQSLRIDEHASKIALRGTTYDVVLLAASTDAAGSATVRLEIIAPNRNHIASSSSPAQLKIGGNKLSASITLPELPKKSDDLPWYRLGYSITLNGAELAHGILPLFESVQDFALHVSAPALVQPGKKFFVRVHTSHPVLDRPVSGVGITAQVRGNANEAALVAATGTTDANGYAVLSMLLAGDVQNRDLELAVQAQRGAVTAPLGLCILFAATTPVQ
jgi:hypothetical protein